MVLAGTSRAARASWLVLRLDASCLLTARVPAGGSGTASTRRATAVRSSRAGSTFTRWNWVPLPCLCLPLPLPLHPARGARLQDGFSCRSPVPCGERVPDQGPRASIRPRALVRGVRAVGRMKRCSIAAIHQTQLQAGSLRPTAIDWPNHHTLMELFAIVGHLPCMPRYIFDHRNASLRAWLLDVYIGGSEGIGST